MLTGNRIYEGEPASDFIAPTDVTRPFKESEQLFSSEENAENNPQLTDKKPLIGVLSNGYAAEFFTAIRDETQKIIKYEIISPNYYNFDYFSGILTFNSTVSDEMLETFEKQGVYISAFQYIGKKVLDYFKDLELLIEKANDAIQRVKNESIAVQRITFSTGDKECLPTNNREKFEDYASPYFNTDKYKQRYVQNFSVNIPGYCWELTFGEIDKSKYPELQNIDMNVGGVFITDIQHFEEAVNIENNITIKKQWSYITFQLEVLGEPEDIAKYGDKPVLAWIDIVQKIGNTEKIIKKPVCGDYNLIATVFTRHDKRSIDVLPDKTLKSAVKDYKRG